MDRWFILFILTQSVPGLPFQSRAAAINPIPPLLSKYNVNHQNRTTQYLVIP